MMVTDKFIEENEGVPECARPIIVSLLTIYIDCNGVVFVLD